MEVKSHSLLQNVFFFTSTRGTRFHATGTSLSTRLKMAKRKLCVCWFGCASAMLCYVRAVCVCLYVCNSMCLCICVYFWASLSLSLSLALSLCVVTHSDHPLQAVVEGLLLVRLYLLQRDPGLSDKLVVAKLILVAHWQPETKNQNNPT